jgi:Flp pilus assembly protein TadD
MRFWIQSLRARKLGDVGRAEQLEREAEAEGFAEGSRLRAYRTVAQAGLLREAGQLPRAEREYRRALEEDPEQAEALYGLAAVHIQRNRSEAADSTLARLVHLHPEHAEGWSLLGLLRSRTGDMAGARQAFARALDASPYFSAALGNAGLLAVEAGDRSAARDLLDRLRAISPLGTTTEERALLKALGRAGES